MRLTDARDLLKYGDAMALAFGKALPSGDAVLQDLPEPEELVGFLLVKDALQDKVVDLVRKAWTLPVSPPLSLMLSLNALP